MYEELIRALRCSISTGEHDCLNCKYCFREEIKDGIPVLSDVTLEGKEYWLSCDIDKMTLDAIDILEKIGAENGKA